MSRVVGRHAAYRAIVDGTLLPAVMEQIFVDNRDFIHHLHRCRPFENGGDGLATAHPRMADLCIADTHLVWVLFNLLTFSRIWVLSLISCNYII